MVVPRYNIVPNIQELGKLNQIKSIITGDDDAHVLAKPALRATGHGGGYRGTTGWCMKRNFCMQWKLPRSKFLGN